MKHMLMHPAYPDIVREAASDDPDSPAPAGPANDNKGDPAAASSSGFADYASEFADPFIAIIGAMEIAATRLW